MVLVIGRSVAVKIFFLFQVFQSKKGSRKEMHTAQKIYFGTEEDSEESFHETDFMFNFSSCDKTELPVDPLMSFMNASAEKLYMWKDLICLERNC